MSQYAELVKALRETATFTKFDDLLSKREQKLESLAFDAAAAIEELQAEIRESMQKCAECGDRMVEPKRGEWVYRADFGYMDMNEVEHNHFMCNKCGFIHDFLDGHTSQYEYCPNCGAKMNGEQNVE